MMEFKREYSFSATSGVPKPCLFIKVCSTISYKCNYYFCATCKNVIRYTDLGKRDYDTQRCPNCGCRLYHYCHGNAPPLIEDILNSNEIKVTERLTGGM